MNSFGKKKRSSRRVKKSSNRKPPARLLKMCKKYGIKTTRKVGGRRVYKKTSHLKKACLKCARSHRKKLKKLKKLKKRSASFGRRKKGCRRRKSMRRRSAFGNIIMGSPFERPSNYGYNEEVKQAQQTLSQTSSVVDDKTNSSRPGEMQLPQGTAIYGVNREFFGQQIPTQVPPEWNFMGQSDGSLYPVGASFYGYKTPIAAAFGKKRRRYNVKGSSCNGLKKRICHGNANCTYTKRGCRRRSGTVKNNLVFYGPNLEFGKKRRRYNVKGSACNGLKKRICNGNANCTYTKRGCRRRSGTVKNNLVFYGPNLQFGRSRFGQQCNSDKPRPPM